MAMNDHEWPAVMAALQDWLEHSQENEPSAETFHVQLENVIANMPDEAFE